MTDMERGIGRRALLAGGAAAAGLLAGGRATAAAGPDRVVHAGALIDGIAARARGPASILLSGDRIVAVEAGHLRPDGATVIDLSALTVLPGFINMHMHMDTRPGSLNPVMDGMQNADLDHLMQGAANARDMLWHGFTSARALGSLGEDAALKRGIANGFVPGPRLWVALEQLGATGSVADRSVGFDPALSHPDWRRRTIDSPEQAAWLVRDRRKRGADLIKVMAGGAVTSLSDEDVGRQALSDEEIRAVVVAARAFRMKVAAHAYGSEAIRAAVAGGVDSIEHGSFADRDALSAMRDRRVYLVPTLTILMLSQERARLQPDTLNPVIRAKTLAVGDRPMETVALAHRLGVPIAFGSDAVVPERQADEFGHLTRAGLSPMQAIACATTNAADLLGAADRVGSIQPGRFADLVAVAGDPLADIGRLSRPVVVMKGGAMVRDERRG